MNLTQVDFQALAKSYITPELALAAQLMRVTSAEGAALVGRNGVGDYAGISFPNIWPGETAPREYMLRVDHLELETRPDGTTCERAKYLAPPGRANLLYIPPGVTPAMPADVGLPIMMCGGAKEALAFWRLQTDMLPINRILVEALGRLKTTATSEWVFVNRSGHPHKSIQTAFQNACRRATLADVTPHTLRHTFASRLGMQGAGERTLQALGRWKEPKMILRYVHLSQEHLGEAVERLAENSPTIFTTPAREAEPGADAKLSSAS